MSPAICMCLVMTGVCVYVGMHVIMREIIFIDIALAQVSAVGASLAIFWGLELSSPWTWVISLGSTLLAALLLTGTRQLDTPVPQEAFIGILYALASAGTFLLGDRLAHGSEHVKDVISGHLLWTNWKEVGIYSIFYLGLGSVYASIHNRLIFQSQNHSRKGLMKGSDLLWEFLFYALLAIMVTVAVRVAGVLLVFGFLVVPAVIGTLLGSSFRSRLVIAWCTGFLVSIGGAYLSYALDFPTGPMIVVTLGVALFLVTAIREWARAQELGPGNGC